MVAKPRIDSLDNHDKSKTPMQAVALQYDPADMIAPTVLAKGRGSVAEKIIALAAEQGIPLQQDPVLVQALNQLDLGDEIPAELYRVVAEILVFIMQTDAKTLSR